MVIVDYVRHGPALSTSAVKSFSPFGEVVAVGDSGTVIRSIDYGNTWSLLPYPSSVASLTSVSVRSVPPLIVVAGDNYEFMRSTDGGQTWAFANPEPPPQVTQEQASAGGEPMWGPIYFHNDTLGFVGGIYGLFVYRTSNGGMNWISHPVSGITRITGFFFFSADTGIVVGRPGAARATTDGGLTWFESPELTTLLNGRNIQKIVPRNEHMASVIADSGLGVMTADDSTLLTTIRGTPTTPGRFELAQNYPNPFNPTTNIVYRVPTRASVELKVFDLLGREVATLVNEVKNAGEYSATFDGRSLASGVYLYRLQAGDYVATKKLVLLR